MILKIWILTAVSLLAKHIIFFLPLTLWSYLKLDQKKALFLWISAILILIGSVVPYAIFGNNPHRVLSQVFLYGGAESHFGIPYFLNYLFNGGDLSFIARRTYRYIFIFFLIVFSYYATSKNIMRSLLLTVLFFFTFTSGIATQYMVIPIIFGAFFPTKWFYLFTISVTLFYLGTVEEFDLAAFKTFSWNTVWLFTICWFFSELLIRFPHATKIINGIRKPYKL